MAKLLCSVALSSFGTRSFALCLIRTGKSGIFISHDDASARAHTHRTSHKAQATQAKRLRAPAKKKSATFQGPLVKITNWKGVHLNPALYQGCCTYSLGSNACSALPSRDGATLLKHEHKLGFTSQLAWWEHTFVVGVRSASVRNSHFHVLANALISALTHRKVGYALCPSLLFLSTPACERMRCGQRDPCLSQKAESSKLS